MPSAPDAIDAALSGAKPPRPPKYREASPDARPIEIDAAAVQVVLVE